MRLLAASALAILLASCAAAPIAPPDSKWLPSNQFGSLTGTFERVTRNPRGKGRPDDNHLYLWVRVDANRSYECAVNTSRDSQVATLTFEGTRKPAGFEQVEQSYDEIKVRESDFRAVSIRELQSDIENRARQADVITAYGTTYPGGEGMHLIHLQDHNSNPRFRSKHGQDGMLVFWKAGKGTAMLFKFSNQHLPR